MNFLKYQIKNFLWKSSLRRCMKDLNIDDPFVAKIYLAIEETLSRKEKLEEKCFFTSIEQIRQNFLSNSTSVLVVDFGVGKPEEIRSKKEIKEGITHLSTYGEIALGSKPEIWAVLLSNLIRQFQPITGIELGTCIGISAAYQGVAIKLNGKGQLFTLEGSPAIADIARDNLKSLDLDMVSVITGRFIDTLPKILEENAPIDYVFIDGHHDEKATWDYYQLLLPFLSSQALLVFDDISWSSGMKNVWKKIASNNKVALSVDLDMVGICVMK
jgi:Predicted O-methyltransferase